jgi:hypothetical protein
MLNFSIPSLLASNNYELADQEHIYGAEKTQYYVFSCNPNLWHINMTRGRSSLARQNQSSSLFYNIHSMTIFSELKLFWDFIWKKLFWDNLVPLNRLCLLRFNGNDAQLLSLSCGWSWVFFIKLSDKTCRQTPCKINCNVLPTHLTGKRN